MSAPDPIEPFEPAAPAYATSRDQLIGAIMYLVAAFLFALNGSVAKAQIEAGLSAAQVTEVRTFGCALVLLVYLLITKRSSLRVRRSEWPFLLLFGVLAYAMTPFFYFVSVSLLPVAIAALLAFLAPVLVALWLRFVKKEQVGRSIWIALALVVIGLLLVSQAWAGWTLNPLGILFGLITAAALAAYLLLGESGTKRRDVMSLAFYGFAIATVTWSILAPWWNFPWATLRSTTSLFDGAMAGVPVWSLVLLMIAVSVGNTRRDLVEAAYTLGSKDRGVVTRVLLPSAAPEIAETLRMVLGWAWTYVIVAELIGASSGIGHMITDSQALMATDQIIFGIIVIGAIGLVTDFVFKSFNRWLFPWARLA